MISWIKGNSVYISLLLIVSLYTFADIKDVFYQQDEWHALGSYFSQNSFWELFNVNIAKAFLGEGRIFSSIVGYLLLKNMPFENFPLAFYSLAFHFLNTLLVFQIAFKLIGKKVPSILSSIFFLVCSVSTRTISWYSTSIGTLPATTLILLSVMFFWESMAGKKNHLFFSYILLYFSQPFKEIGYFLFLVLPVSVFIYQRLSFANWVKKYWYFILTFLFITIYRISQLNSYSLESAVFTEVSSHNFFLTIGLRAILYPLTSFSLVFIPSEFLIRAAKVFTNHYYPFFPTEHYNLIVQSAVLDLIALTLSFTLGLFLIVISLKTVKQVRKNIIFTVFLIFSTFLPYVILSKTYAYLDARYYYLGAAFSGILIGFLIMGIKSISKKSYFSSSIFFVVVVYLFWQMQTTRSDLNKLAMLSRERKNILNQLSEIKNDLGRKNVFLVTGDQHYYLAEDNYVPLQQGIGYTILVWLNREKPQFRQLLKDETLWDLGSQGYFEINNGAFGYFWDEVEFRKILSEKKLNPGEFTALYYESKNGKLRDITSSFFNQKSGVYK